ncbi:11384_t:CDS:2 [Funneliformis mosseae]|uniref:11384_t:CDS:1 n=1 Tax=Funneliformis mosseae TaxID=27381 RepID=A0A9N8YIY1_FUNMO|nr:11384_t:CDS:2 [Funneliformis mosseae]
MAADELCINELVERIQEFLLYNPELILTNLVLIHRFVTEYDHFTELQTFCLNTINQDPAIFFEAKDFITIDQNTLLFILKASNLIMKEIDLWNKIVEWGIAQDPLLSHDIKTWTSDHFSTFRNIVQPFVNCIKFSLISQDDFFEKVRPFNQEIGVESLSSGIGTYSGPSFGGSETDLQLWGNFNEERYCRCVKTSYEYKIRESEDYFSVDDYEVFQVVRIFSTT